jgi:hypothetical protein
MRRLVWDRAESDLEAVSPEVVVQLKRNAAEILHDIPPVIHPDEGIRDGIMWHRAATWYDLAEEQPDGPQNYFLFYTRNGSGREFEILAVRSIYEIASTWVRMSLRPHGQYD